MAKSLSTYQLKNLGIQENRRRQREKDVAALHQLQIDLERQSALRLDKITHKLMQAVFLSRLHEFDFEKIGSELSLAEIEDNAAR